MADESRVCLHFNHFNDVTINSHTNPNIIWFPVGCCESGTLWHLVANLGAITHHTDNLGPITCHGKPLCHVHMLPCSLHFELFYELYTSIWDNEYFLLKWSCAVRYDVIYHPFVTNSQDLKTWRGWKPYRPHHDHLPVALAWDITEKKLFIPRMLTLSIENTVAFN